MANRIEYILRVPADVAGSVGSLLSGVTIILLLWSRPVGSVDVNSTTTITEYVCGNCTASNCREVTDCNIGCEGCDAPMYRLHPIYSPHCLDSRKKRQVPPDQPTLPPPTTTTPETTTVKNAWICKSCSVVGCSKCIDLMETPTCEVCQAGYQLNNVTNTCSNRELEDGLSGVAIAGIVIAVVCVVGIAIVIVLYVRRKFRGSRDVTARSQRMQDSPKNDKKSFSRGSQENKELEELGEAPSPPTGSNDYTDMQQKYDPLDTKNQNEPQLYLPMQPDKDAVYLNTAAVENEFRQSQGLYENTQQASHQTVNQAKSSDGNTAKHPALATSQESMDLYEPVGTASSSAPETQDVYENDAAFLVQNGAAETDDTYLNVYQNA